MSEDKKITRCFFYAGFDNDQLFAELTGNSRPKSFPVSAFARSRHTYPPFLCGPPTRLRGIGRDVIQ